MNLEVEKMENHEKYMQLAIDLALKGQGRVAPNPLVGAVIVKDGKIISQAYHEKYGQLHAERKAIMLAKESLKGSTMYVNLEPCCHYGKTPPCTDIIIESGIERVFVGSRDPNPQVAGKGCQILREHGIEVIESFMQKECDSINKIFFKYIKEKMPYLVMKYAMTMDGKIASHTGKSKWITANQARGRVHLDRHRYFAIMIGVNTAIEDDPMLNARIEEIKNIIPEEELENYGIIKDREGYQVSQPVRIVCDTNLRMSLDSKLVKSAKEYKTIIATCSEDFSKIKSFEEKSCQIIRQEKAEKIDLKSLLISLGQMGIDSILLEGGASLNWSALEAGLVDQVDSYIGRKLFGGANAKTPISGRGVDSPDKSYKLNIKKVNYYGGDIMIESEVVNCLQE